MALDLAVCGRHRKLLKTLNHHFYALLEDVLRLRAIAASALLALTLFSTTACNLIAPQATTIKYSPAEGVSVPQSEGAPVTVRNALFVADEAGENANFVAALINETNQPHYLTIQHGTGADALTQVIVLAPNQTLTPGANDEAPIPFNGLNAAAGTTVPIYFQSGTAPGVTVQIPVQSGDMEYFKNLVPGNDPVVTE